ncbi:hypothetical protein ACFWPJ_33395, partial [Nocardia sp. NPDC058497]
AGPYQIHKNNPARTASPPAYIAPPLERPRAGAALAVVGLPDDDLGQRIVAFVVPREGGSAELGAELIAHVGEQVSAHKRPREVRFVDTLPRNAMGKVQKKRLG